MFLIQSTKEKKYDSQGFLPGMGLCNSKSWVLKLRGDDEWPLFVPRKSSFVLNTHLGSLLRIHPSSLAVSKVSE